MSEPTPDALMSAAQLLGRKGGKLGGHARARALTKEQRCDIARRAACRRWGSVPVYIETCWAMVNVSNGAVRETFYTRQHAEQKRLAWPAPSCVRVARAMIVVEMPRDRSAL